MTPDVITGLLFAAFLSIAGLALLYIQQGHHLRQLRRELAAQLDLIDGLHHADERQLAANAAQMRVNDAVIKRLDALDNGLRDTTFGVVRQESREATKRVTRPGGAS